MEAISARTSFEIKEYVEKTIGSVQGFVNEVVKICWKHDRGCAGNCRFKSYKGWIFISVHCVLQVLSSLVVWSRGKRMQTSSSCHPTTRALRRSRANFNRQASLSVAVKARMAAVTAQGESKVAGSKCTPPAGDWRFSAGPGLSPTMSQPAVKCAPEYPSMASGWFLPVIRDCSLVTGMVPDVCSTSSGRVAGHFIMLGGSGNAQIRDIRHVWISTR